MKTSFLTSRTAKSIAALLALTAITTISQPAQAQPVTANVLPKLGFYADNTNAGYTFLTMNCNITAPTGTYYLYFPNPAGGWYKILGTGSNTSPTRSVSFGLAVDIPKNTPDLVGAQMWIWSDKNPAGWWTTPFSFQIRSHFATVTPPAPAFNWTGTWKHFVSIGSSSGAQQPYVYTFTKAGTSFNMAMTMKGAFKSWTESAVLTASGTGGTHLSGSGTGTYVDNVGRTATYHFNITFDETSTSSASSKKTITSVSKPTGITVPVEIATGKTETVEVNNY